MHFGRLPGLRVCRAAFSAPDDPLGTVITEPPPMGCAGGVTRQAVRLIAQHDLYISLKDAYTRTARCTISRDAAGRREDGFRGIRPTIVEFAHVVRVVAEDVLVGDHTTPEATHLLDASRAREIEKGAGRRWFYRTHPSRSPAAGHAVDKKCGAVYSPHSSRVAA